MNGNDQAAIKIAIQNILDSIPNLKQTLTSIKEGEIQYQDLSEYPYTIASPRDRHRVYNVNGMQIKYVIPDSVNSLRSFYEYIDDKGRDKYIILGRIGGSNWFFAEILIKNGVSSLANANTYKASKNFIKITVQGGGRRRKHTKKDRKHRNRTRKHRS